MILLCQNNHKYTVLFFSYFFFFFLWIKSFIKHKTVYTPESLELCLRGTQTYTLRPNKPNPNKPPATTQGAEHKHPNQQQTKFTSKQQNKHRNSETATKQKQQKLKQHPTPKQSTLDQILQGRSI